MFCHPFSIFAFFVFFSSFVQIIMAYQFVNYATQPRNMPIPVATPTTQSPATAQGTDGINNPHGIFCSNGIYYAQTDVFAYPSSIPILVSSQLPDPEPSTSTGSGSGRYLLWSIHRRRLADFRRLLHTNGGPPPHRRTLVSVGVQTDKNHRKRRRNKKKKQAATHWQAPTARPAEKDQPPKKN